MKKILLTLCGLCLALATLQAATYTVTKTADTNDGVCDGDCSLREAIAAAEANPGGDNIVFSNTITQPIIISSPFLVITSDLTIDGSGASNLTISGGNASRIFWIQNGTITLQDLTLADGYAKGGDGGGGGMGAGGAIFMHEGKQDPNNATGVSSGSIDLRLINVTLKNNKAIGGNGPTWVNFNNGGGGMGGNSDDGGGGVLGNGDGAGGSVTNANGYTPGDNGGIAIFGSGGGLGPLAGFGGGGLGNGGFGGGGGNGYQNNGGNGGFGGGGGATTGPSSSYSSGGGGFGGGGGGANQGNYGGGGGFGGGNGVGGLNPNSGVFGSGGGAGFGGAIFVASGKLTLQGVTFEGNTATGGTGAVNNGKGYGGALFIFNAADNGGNAAPGTTNPPSVVACGVTYTNNTAGDAADNNSSNFYNTATDAYTACANNTQPTVYKVNNTNDNGAGSLRQAIADANADPTATAANPHLIDATGVTGTINVTIDPTNLRFFLVITNHITIKGSGQNNLTISGNGTNRIFWIQNGTITLQDLTLADGYAKGGDGGGGGMGAGGAIFMHEGRQDPNNATGVLSDNIDLRLINVTLKNNRAIGGNGNTDADNFGGGGMGGNGSADAGAGGVLGNGAVAGGSVTAAVGNTPGTNGSIAVFGSGNGSYGGGGEGGGNNGGFGGGGGGGINGSAGSGGFGGGSGSMDGNSAYGTNGGFGGGGGGGGGSGGNTNGFGGFGGGRGVAQRGGGGAGFGGAIFVASGSLTLEDVLFEDNRATGGIGGIISAPEFNGKGYGGALFIFNKADNGGNAAPGTTNDPQVIACGVTYTNNSAADDLNTATNNDNIYGSTIGNVCTADLAISATSASKAEGNSGGTTDFTFTVTRSGNENSTVSVAYAVSGTVDGTDFVGNMLPSGMVTFNAMETMQTITIPVQGDLIAESDESFTVTLSMSTGDVSITTDKANGTIQNDDVLIIKIHDVQGPVSSSPLTGQTVTIEGVVIGDYQIQGSGQLSGFFVQEEDADVDADPATSEGIFVFCSSCPTAVAVGDKVQVTGSASEFSDMTQLTASTAGSVVVISSNNPLPTPATVQLPVPSVPSGDLTAATAVINAYFEPFEGMLVTFSATLSVSEHADLARYGQVLLSQGGRFQQFTNNTPPSVSGFANHQIDIAKRSIILDDTDNRQNRPIDVPNTAYYHPVPGLSTSNFFRAGDQITNLTGVLHWSFAGQAGTDAWRIRPVPTYYSYAFTSANPRPAAPATGGNLKVVSFNVNNYFLSIDNTSSSSSGPCGASATLDCGGADSSTERDRQQEKLTAVLNALNADIVGLVGIENTPNVDPLTEMVADLNAVAGPGTYAAINTNVNGTETTRVGLIYKPAKVTPIGSPSIDNAAVHNRPPVAQLFEDATNGRRFTVIVNHFKSKDCTDATGADLDQLDGQGCYNALRTSQANALLTFVNTVTTQTADPDVLIVGDLNAYAKEDPIVALQNGGFTNLIMQFEGTNAYNVLDNGQLGYLGHALGNASLAAQVTAAGIWHINADEIALFDYNDDVKDTGEPSFEEESDALPLYEANQLRSSRYDPLIVGLDLAPPCPASGIVYVNASAANGGDGLNWNTAFNKLQDALNLACNCIGTKPEIWVAQGTYYPDEGINQTDNDRNSTFQLCNNVKLYGGFSGNINDPETMLSDRNVATNVTILSGDLDKNDTPNFGNNSNNAYHVVTGSGTNNTAILDGFTITAGNANSSFPDDSGSGMKNEAGSPTVGNCTFSGNASIAFGGGMVNYNGSSPNISSCTFSGNKASNGGGISNFSNANPTIINSIFSNNTAMFSGGGMHNQQDVMAMVVNCTFFDNTASTGGGMANYVATPIVTNCIFIRNHSISDGGGGMLNASSSTKITNCIFDANTSEDEGGGMFNFGACIPEIVNCTFAGNTAKTNGGGIANLVDANPEVTNCIFFNNTALLSAPIFHNAAASPTISYSSVDVADCNAVNINVSGGMGTCGAGMKYNTNPLFVDADGADNTVGTLDDDLRLLPSSPVINMGNNAAVPADSKDVDNDSNTAEPTPDLDLNDRIFDDALDIVDLGAYESQCVTPTGTISSNLSAICKGESVELTFTATVGAGPFDIVVNGTPYNEVVSGSVFATLSPNSNTNYTLTQITDNNGCIAANLSQAISVTVTNCQVTAFDPCTCKNNATTLTNGQFGETIQVNGPSGQTWTITNVSGLLKPDGVTPYQMGDALTELPAGTYTLNGVHVDAVGYTISVSNGRGITASVGNSCAYPNPAITLDPAYCKDEPAVLLTGTPGDANILSQSFKLDGTTATILNPAALTIGNHTIEYTVDGGKSKASGPNDPGCIQTVSQQVRIDPQVVVDAGSTQTICRTKTLSLSGLDVTITYTGGNLADLQYSWSIVEVGNNGSLSDTSTTAPKVGTYTPSADAIARGYVTLRLTVNNPNDACDAVSDTVRVNIQNVDCGQFPWNGN